MISQKTQDLINKYPDLIEANLQAWIDRELQSGSLKERKERFRNLVKAHIEKYSYEMCKEFYDYWTEKSDNGRKMRFEMEKTFEVKKRLVRWKKNAGVKDEPVKASMPQKYHGR